MARVEIVTDSEGRFYGLGFECPGCGLDHVLPVHWLPEGLVESPAVSRSQHWTFNGDLARPTLSPAVLARWERHGKAHCCHSFVQDGRIQFLSDSTHALAGQTVGLPEVDDGEHAGRAGD